MKKIISVFLISALVILLVPALFSYAGFGGGVEAMAEGVSVIKTGLSGQKIQFSDTDFKSALCITSFKSITVNTLPSSNSGTLMLAGRRVREGQTIKRKNIASLVFVPSSKDVTECSFEFTISEVAGGAPILCTLKFIDKVNYAPSVNDVEESIMTQADISVFDTMNATDPEGDKLEFIVVSYPKYGRLEREDSTGARYRYTPYTSFVGSDSFTYVVRDEYGNFSTPKRVLIDVNERMSGVVFSDMTDRAEYSAAVAMTALGVMYGEEVGDEVHFNPDKSVSRAEFVTMAMKMFGIRRDTTITTSYFDDNADIPSALMGYVATAQRLGIVNGSYSGGQLLFRPNDAITKYEAAKILSQICGVKTEGADAVFADINAVPVWARPGVYTMYSLGIFDSTDGNLYGTSAVSRAECADYLYKLYIAVNE